MPTNIPENKFVCINRARDGVIPYWVQSLDIDEQNNVVVANLVSKEFFECLSETIEGHNAASQTDTAKPQTYQTSENPDLNSISFKDNIEDALHFIRYHEAISEDSYQRSLSYLANCLCNQKDPVKVIQPEESQVESSSPLPGKFEEEKESSQNSLGQAIGSYLNIPSSLFTHSKDLSMTSTESPSTSNKCTY